MTKRGFDFLVWTAKNYKHLIALVVIGKDSSIDCDYEEDILLFCIKNTIPYVKKCDFKCIHSKYVVAVAWRWIINHPQHQLIVFHDSLLPRYRGFAPLVNSLINGETEIGVTALFGSKEYDTGDIITSSTSSITYPITIQQAIQTNISNYLNCASVIFSKISTNLPLDSYSQNEDLASYSLWRDDNDYKIDWFKSAQQIRRFVDAVGVPYKGAYSIANDNVVRILSVLEMPSIVLESVEPGKVIFIREGHPFIVTGHGLIQITKAYIESDSGCIPLLPLKRFRTRFS